MRHAEKRVPHLLFTAAGHLCRPTRDRAASVWGWRLQGDAPNGNTKSWIPLPLRHVPHNDDFVHLLDHFLNRNSSMEERLYYRRARSFPDVAHLKGDEVSIGVPFSGGLTYRILLRQTIGVVFDLQLRTVPL